MYAILKMTGPLYEEIVVKKNPPDLFIRPKRMQTENLFLFSLKFLPPAVAVIAGLDHR